MAVNCSWADAQLSSDPILSANLPSATIAAIKQSSGSAYLENLATASLLNNTTDTHGITTDRILTLYEPLIPELTARWTTPGRTKSLSEDINILACMARFFPFARYLRSRITRFLHDSRLQSVLYDVSPSDLSALPLSVISDADIATLLMALFRLLSSEPERFRDEIRPTFLSSFLSHRSLCIRYLAIQCLCIVMHFADALSEKMVERHAGIGRVEGLWEGKLVDFHLLKLLEEKRWRDLDDQVNDARRRVAESLHVDELKYADADLSSRTASIGGILVPRTEDLQTFKSSFVETVTAKQNLRSIGSALLQSKPVLVNGMAGVGKTTIITESARLLNKQSSMITLHLNEQTDAKSLLGIYTSSTTGESFTWQPGVLTKAIQQGRWVLIEDIDRAPAEVLGVLRPVIENGELFLPSRKERLQPAEGFRLFATIKTSSRSASFHQGRHAWLSNERLWSTVRIENYEVEEIQELLSIKYPMLRSLSPAIMDAHERVCAVYRDEPRFRAVQSRQPSLRDLLKWCRRISHRIQRDLESMQGGIPEMMKLDIFRDAIDCYAALHGDINLVREIAARIAQAMNISPQQVDHVISTNVLEVMDKKSTVNFGRISLKKVEKRRPPPAKKSVFAMTNTASRIISSIATSTGYSEPLLLVGETGVGKTTIVQHIASLVNQTLTVINLSQQSEASDLLGGLKPITTRSLIIPLLDQFNTLFDDTFSNKRNEKFQIAVTKAFAKQNWQRLLLLWQEAVQMAQNSLKKPAEISIANDEIQTAKRRKVATKYTILNDRWMDFASKLNLVRSQVERGDKNHTFAFVEGRLVQAVRGGEWLLLDEINLASADTLDNIVSLLHNGDDESPSLLLTEAGNIEKITAHPDFRVFAAMNPATDAGKKDLAPGLRSRFTELYVSAGDGDIDDLVKIIATYLGAALSSDKRAAIDLANAYLALKQLNEQHKLTDGAGDTPHFSIRSLVRCLQYVIQHSPSHGLRRSMHEGFAMSFFTVLSRESENLVLPLLEKHILSNVKNPRSFLSQQPKITFDDSIFVAFRHHLVVRGPESPDLQPHYIRTPSVERNLINLARATSMRRFPILLQGPTSAGKTSMVEYLAKLSGNKFVRINNHEHTDLQEYLGSYATGEDGKLEFREGVLVEALRKGHWIVLDELNLAPSDVLEALNRLLDDNRELLIPETQEVVRPHPNFMLFATQNPAGLYGGRKRLSRAFRNRFLELHFDDIPEDELEVILRERAQIAPSYCSQIVQVYKKLSLQRQSTRLFEQRNSFATLRDLFRWAARPADSREQLAQQGFMLLGERCRDQAETMVVKTTIEETMKCKINQSELYGSQVISTGIFNNSPIVWTSAMRRLFVLVSAALKNNEPVLLVGETGCGKTQICQTIAQVFDRSLSIYNAHSNTETGDLIGSQRPIRQRSELANAVIENFNEMSDDQYVEKDVDMLIDNFEKMDTSGLDPQAVAQTRKSIGAYKSLFAWNDGSLVRAMRSGEHFLLDEISLADDSVLERLNSVLEPSRTILLAEKGTGDNYVVAKPGFQFLATMNPGGDYGKRELSAALRNRLTEIWVPPLSQGDDILPILQAKLGSDNSRLASAMIDFAVWFRDNLQNLATTTIPLRNLLTWADFVNKNSSLGAEVAFIHGAAMVYVDSLGANPAGLTSITNDDIDTSRDLCLTKLQTLTQIDVFALYREIPNMQIDQEALMIGCFSLPRRPSGKDDTELVFDATTTLRNTMRIVRALQIYRPILLEGSPGVGKTAIVTALAAAVGKPLTRINLSDQTDLMDLFGADVPCDGENIGHFSWRDGPLLQAMQTGGWVLLDEMNLASQSVLEGLNSCLDHRHEVYIAELDKSFVCHPDFTLFAAQNPHHQGGGRKGLPASFVNRFTIVYADPFKREDLLCICRRRRPNVSAEYLEAIVDAITNGHEVVTKSPEFNVGGPWELNLRDVNRWLDLCEDQPMLSAYHHFEIIISQRFRGRKAKASSHTFWPSQENPDSQPTLSHNLSPTLFQCGTGFLTRSHLMQPVNSTDTLQVLDLPYVKSVIMALNKGWPIVLAGPSGSGKTRLIRSMAALKGAKLVEFSMNSDVDTMDLIGGFEQHDARRDLLDIQTEFYNKLVTLFQEAVISESRDALLMGALTAICRDVGAKGVTLAQLDAALTRAIPVFPGVLDSIREKMQKIKSAAQQTGSNFVWNDGTLIDAIQTGSWIVLDNANLCNPSVLDRLNSLLEPNGTLVVSEQHNSSGDERVIETHKDFRIFLTMDPRYGELSRAMRNRSLELYMEGSEIVPMINHLPCYPTSAHISRLRLILDASTDSMMRGSPMDPEPFLESISYDDLKRVQNGWNVILEHGPTLNDVERLVQNWHGLPEHIRVVGIERYQKTTFDDSDNAVPASLSLQDYWASMTSNQPQIVAVNDALVSLSSVGSAPFEQNARIIWASLECVGIKQMLESIAQTAKQMKLDQMSVLQKSLVLSDRGSRRQQQTGVSAAQLIKMLITYVKDTASAKQADYDAKMGSEMLCLARDLITFFNTPNQDDAVLQAYLQILRELSAKSSGVASTTLKEAMNFFKSQHSLSFGLSLQRMWPSWSPIVASNHQQLEAQLLTEDLLSRFDNLAVTLPHSRPTLARIRSRLVNACISVVADEDSATAVATLSRAVDELATHTERSKAQSGHFSPIFDWLLRTLAIKKAFRDDNECQLLSLFAHDTSILHADEESNLKLLAFYNQQSHTEEGVCIHSGIDVGKSLLSSSADVNQEPLSAYKYIVEETNEIANVLCNHVTDLEDEASHVVPAMSVDLIWSILDCHKDMLTDNARSYISSRNDLAQFSMSTANEIVQDTSEEGLHFKTILQTHILPSITLPASPSSQQPLEVVGKILVNVSLAALKLLVPDRVFDPAIYPALVKHRHDLRASELRRKIEAHKRFQMRFTGDSTSLLVRMFESDLRAIGDVPHAPAVVRPAKSELNLVQEEFSNVVRAVLQNHQLHRLTSPTEPLPTELSSLISISSALGETAKRLVSRLSLSNRAYDDIVKPVTWLLGCLELGSSLISKSLEQRQHSQKQAINNSFDRVPFLGGKPADVYSIQTLPNHDRLSSYELRTHLQHLNFVSAIERRNEHNSPIAMINFLDVADHMYNVWRSRLSKDQREADVRSRYYTYRGGDEAAQDEDSEEMASLFPTYEGDDEELAMSKPQQYDARSISIMIAKMHQQLISGDIESQPIANHIIQTLDTHNGYAEHIDGADVSLTFLLPGIFLQLERSLDAMTTNEPSKALNIYTDTDVVEVQKLLTIVNEVQSRFEAITTQWPDHAVPIEVLNYTDELLTFRIDEPIAKLLTKTEKLLDIIAQWQSVASREWSVTNLMGSLTNLIISWRRLELSSWSRLLDIEQRKNEEDASAWYFIAYEAVIYNSRLVVEQTDNVTSYCRELVSTLEEFMKTTTVGQFSCRLRLLQILQETLKVTAQRDEKLIQIVACVSSVLNHYRRYEEHIQQVLNTGRADLEKNIKEQIQLASWKDTNPASLRESARRSHHKLFKIVRKYRALLSQPMATFKANETKFDTLSITGIVLFDPPIGAAQLQQAALTCAANIDDWKSRPARLTDPTGAVLSMRRVYVQQDCLDVAVELSSFRVDISSTARELRRQTPQTLTEENTPAVRHLRERKRRLLADTMKTLAHMGIRRNMGTNELSAQNSTSVVLASSPDLVSVVQPGEIVSAANDTFHEILDVMPGARLAAREHSDDLTDGEVMRGLGFLEGLLAIDIAQRASLNKAADDLRSLSSSLSILKHMQAMSASNVVHAASEHESRREWLVRCTAWLPQLLQLAGHILNFQAKRAGLNIQDLLSSMNSFALKLKEDDFRLTSLETLPNCMTSLLYVGVLDECERSLEALKETLENWETKEPKTSYLIRQIIPWTQQPMFSSDYANGVLRYGITDLDIGSRRMLDQIFVAIQRIVAIQTSTPATIEVQGWLAKNDKAFIDTTKSLHIGDVDTALKEIIDHIHCLNPDELPLALALLTIGMPVIEQYYGIAEHVYSKQLAAHLETCRLGVLLSKSYVSLTKEGFCTPSDPSAGQEQSGKLESGTGLGEGEGAEDISKDIGADEDLAELAQNAEQDKKDENEMEKSKDAVDMGADDLEGDMGSGDEQVSDDGNEDDRSGSEDEDGIDEETGSVDELDPSAVDEKMWDDAKKDVENEEKEMKGEKQKGKKTEDQTAKNDDVKNEGDEGVEEPDEVPEGEATDAEDEAEGQGKPEAENVDPRLQEEEALELPEDIQFDGDDGKDDGVSDDGMDDLSDVEQPAGIEPEQVDQLSDADGAEQQNSVPEENPEGNEEGEKEENGEAQDVEIMEDQPEEAEEPEGLKTREDDMQYDIDDNEGGESGAAKQLQTEVEDDQDRTAEGQNNSEQISDEQQAQTGKGSDQEQRGDAAQGASERGAGREDEIRQKQDDALKKLADVLEQFHQRREILTASEEHKQDVTDQDIDMADADFEHLGDDDKEDAQALGAAATDQAQNLDQTKAIGDHDGDGDQDLPMPEDAGADEQQEQPESIVERFSRLQAQPRSQHDGDSGTSTPDQIPDRRQVKQFTDTDMVDEDVEDSDEDDTLQVNQSTSPPISTSDAAALWSDCSKRTHTLSLLLTEQLRLILAPTTATKLRGDFRTGKRLNIKRIIPYIASGYKRDKIWMRRSIPSKRNYQIMIAVDDSKSMSESGADLLAFETLAMLSKSLTMLEAGDLCIVSFGEEQHIRVAHPFGQPFTSAESGTQIFRNFSFNQQGTDVRKLVRESISLFQDARLRSSSTSNQSDIWQLQLIISDGHCSDHDTVRRLVRAAHEQKIMIVFVIVDAGQDSIIDLKEAVFERENPLDVRSEMKVKTKRYLEGFPFQYYVIVKDVADLPSMLARVLKGWFESVVDV